MNDEAATAALQTFFESALRDGFEFDMEQLLTYVGSTSNISLANLGNEMKRLHKKGEIAWEPVPGKDGVYRAIAPVIKASGGRPRKAPFSKKQKKQALEALTLTLQPPIHPAIGILYDWLYEQVNGK